MIKNEMNKRGDITITILVIGILAVCGLTILSFFTSNNLVKGSFPITDVVEEATLIREKISFYESLGYNKEEIKNILELQEDSPGIVILSQPEITVRFAWPE